MCEFLIDHVIGQHAAVCSVLQIAENSTVLVQLSCSGCSSLWWTYGRIELPVQSASNRVLYRASQCVIDRKLLSRFDDVGI